MCPCGCIGKRKKGSFVEKTLTGAADLLRQVMFSEDVALQNGLLQRIDPRVKLISLLVLLVSAGLVHNIAVLLAVYAVTLVLAAASRLPVGFFVKRVWLFVPIFTGIVVLSATLSIVTRGDVVLQLWSWHGTARHGRRIHGPGPDRGGAGDQPGRDVHLAGGAAHAHHALGAAARRVALAGRTHDVRAGDRHGYRYIFLLLGTVTDMYEARTSRTIGAQTHDRGARQFLSASAGNLFGKAHHLSEEVHMAMVSRGYRGDAKSIQSFRLTALDAVAAVTVLATAVVIIGGDHLVGR
ncbi:MAG TPA: CbiQ family ECF transporter T component [Kineosporiaceae bacterium]|nr:CbiQ family ECF transporter T component [Kineosporiaceae bacterium]